MRLDHIQLAIPAGAEDRCRAFWSGILGMAELEKPAALKLRGGCWFTLGEVEIHLGVEAPFAAARKAHPAFVVPKLDNMAQRLDRAGHKVRWDTAIGDRRRFFTEDPVGNRVEFFEEST